MSINVINQKAFENLLAESDSAEMGSDEILACDSCSCDTGSDWVNQVCPAPEWVVGWKKATC